MNYSFKAQSHLSILNVGWVQVYVGIAEITVFIGCIREMKGIGTSQVWPVTWQLKLSVQILHIKKRS